MAVGLTNTTHFLRAVTAGEVTVEANAVNQGRGQQLWRVPIADDRGRPVAYGDVRLQNIDASHRRQADITGDRTGAGVGSSRRHE